MFKEAFQTADQPDGGTKISGGKKTALLTAGISMAGLLFTLGVANAFFGGTVETPDQRVARLDAAHKASGQVIEQAYDIIEKETKVLKNLEMELAGAKIDRENQLPEDQRNYQNINKWATKVQGFSAELGLSRAPVQE
jgi:hypothetical protein